MIFRVKTSLILILAHFGFPPPQVFHSYAQKCVGRPPDKIFDNKSYIYFLVYEYA